ncbi:MAG: exodeoxyribonuclease VII small subunit [Chitinispirillia bacterium]|nr:exodeoxyribonuclease VII small subunit [Chitinispirillia bacterium]MCL2240950.1 exodeoxyribonuclease VII small subunit [Chitinispirillia bacterium]
MATAKKKPGLDSADSPTFEGALTEIEGIARQLECDDLSLEEMLLRFEDGVRLLRFCDASLRNARGKLLELVEGEDGDFITKILGDSLETFTGGENDRNG